jgi:hypothetical protein
MFSFSASLAQSGRILKGFFGSFFPGSEIFFLLSWEILIFRKSFFSQQ